MILKCVAIRFSPIAPSWRLHAPSPCSHFSWHKGVVFDRVFSISNAAYRRFLSLMGSNREKILVDSVSLRQEPDCTIFDIKPKEKDAFSFSVPSDEIRLECATLGGGLVNTGTAMLALGEAFNLEKPSTRLPIMDAPPDLCHRFGTDAIQVLKGAPRQALALSPQSPSDLADGSPKICNLSTLASLLSEGETYTPTIEQNRHIVINNIEPSDPLLSQLIASVQKNGKTAHHIDCVLGSAILSDFETRPDAVNYWTPFFSCIHTMVLNADELISMFKRYPPKEIQTRASLIKTYGQILLTMGVTHVIISDGADPVRSFFASTSPQHVSKYTRNIPSSTDCNDLMDLIFPEKDRPLGNTTGCGDTFAAAPLFFNLFSDLLNTLSCHVYQALTVSWGQYIAAIVRGLKEPNLSVIPREVFQRVTRPIDASVFSDTGVSLFS